MSGIPRVSLGELLTLERRPVTIVPDGQYAEIGTYSFGRGIFHKPPRSGHEVGDKKLFLVRGGDFILQITFAWEGAVALASSAEDGMYGSVRFLTFRVDESRCYAPYLLNYFRTAEGLDQLVRISPGSAGRNRVLSVKRIPELLVPLPPLDEQYRLTSRIEELAAKVEEASTLRRRVSAEAGRLLSSALRVVTEEYSNEIGSLGQGILLANNGLSRRPSGLEAGPIVLRLADVSGGEVKLDSPRRGTLSEAEIKSYGLSDGDLLFVRVNGSLDIVGRCILFGGAPETVCFNDHLIRVRVNPEVFDWRYAALLTRAPLARNYIENSAITTAGQFTINHSMLARIPVPLLPLLEQRRIVAYLDDLQAKVNVVKKLQSETAAELDALMPSILAKAFRGEL